MSRRPQMSDGPKDVEDLPQLKFPRLSCAEEGEVSYRVVVQFSTKANNELRAWLREQLADQAPQLQVKELPFPQDGCVALLVNVTDNGLRVGAEQIMLNKPVREEFGGGHRPFTCHGQHCFENADVPDKFFSSAERQDIISHFLHNVCASEEVTVGGVHFLPGLPIVARCRREQMVEQVFPLHDQDELKRLRKEWLTVELLHQPLDLIANYFGIKITMYFAWLLFYTKALAVPTAVGVFAYLHILYHQGTKAEKYYEGLYAVLFSVFNVVWSTVFLELWKRQCNTLAYSWGTLDMKTCKDLEVNPEFKGILQKNKDTGEPELVESTFDSLRRYCVAVPVFLASLGLTVGALLVTYHIKDTIQEHTAKDSYWLYVPQVLLSVVVIGLSLFYWQLSYTLTSYENHRLKTSHESNLIFKLVTFELVNGYLPLCYTAFYRQDLGELKVQLAALLLTRQLFGFLVECGDPLVRSFLFQYIMAGKVAKLKKQQFRMLSLTAAERESVMTPYTDTVEDYIEMLVQFGYVVLFSAAFPLAALCAFLNNVFEGRGDAFKLCNGLQRPFGERVKNIGVWQIVLETMGYLAITVNCAMLVVFGHFKEWFPSLSTTEVVVYVVVLEHIFFIMKAAIMYVIPDTPSWIETKIAKDERRQHEAMQNEWRRRILSEQTSNGERVD